MHWWFRDGWLGGWLMMIFMLFFWVLVIVGIVLLARWLASRPTNGILQAGHGESAVEILKRRYASGEITREEFLEMRRDLEEPSGQSG